jgi:tetratricopeptide (TPR) repeat protein
MMNFIKLLVIPLFSILFIGCFGNNRSDQSEVSDQNIDSLYLYYIETAKKYEGEGYDSLSIFYYDSAIALKPSHGVINHRGLVKADMGDLEGALSDHDLAIEMGGEYQNNRAYVLIEMGKEKEAFDILESELEKRKDTCGYLYDKAYFMAIKGDLQKFEKIRSELIHTCPNSNLSRHIESNYVNLLLILGDTSKACKVLSRPDVLDDIKTSFANINCDGIGN